MKKLICLLVLVMLVGGCATYSSMIGSSGKEVFRLNNNVKYSIISEDDSGFKLSLVYSSYQFAADYLHVINLAKETFDALAQDICREKSKEFEVYDKDKFIITNDRNWLLGHSYIRADNWVNYK